MVSDVPARAPEWREAARADLLSIVDYISDDNPHAAQVLKDEIEAKVAKLPEHPERYGLAELPARGKCRYGQTTS